MSQPVPDVRIVVLELPLKYLERKILFGKMKPPTELLKPGKERDELIERMLIVADKLQLRMQDIFNACTDESVQTSIAFEVRQLQIHVEVLRAQRENYYLCQLAFAVITGISQAINVYEDFYLPDSGLRQSKPS